MDWRTILHSKLEETTRRKFLELRREVQTDNIHTGSVYEDIQEILNKIKELKEKISSGKSEVGTGTKIDLGAVRTEIRDIINAGDASKVASFVRLAFHTLASYNIFSKTIGLNFNNTRNGGLKEAIKRLEIVKQNHQWISNGDLWTLAGVIAVDVMGGPIIPWGPGRKDGIASEEHEHVPGISLDPNKVREEFEPMGLNDRDIVAFTGAHTVGRCHEQTSEIEGKWTKRNNLFTNQFYVNLKKLGKRLEGQQLDLKKDFYSQSEHDMIMLYSDLALFVDPTFKKYVKIYAKNQQKFFTDFAEAFGKLLRRSLNQSDGSSRFELKGQYNIFFTEEPLAPTLSTAYLIFSAQDPENLFFSVTGKGVDNKGSYEIDGLFVPSSTTITFTRSYTRSNYLSLYRGQYNQELYFGKWGTSIQPNLGNFIIKRVAKVEKSLTGDWRGYYFYKMNDKSDRMLIKLEFTHNEIKGSGSDSVGDFEIINGCISGDSVNFVKKYPQLSQNYQGQRKGSEIWGKWDTGTPDSGGVFLIWGLKSSSNTSAYRLCLVNQNFVI